MYYLRLRSLNTQMAKRVSTKPVTPDKTSVAHRRNGSQSQDIRFVFLGRLCQPLAADFTPNLTL